MKSIHFLLPADPAECEAAQLPRRAPGRGSARSDRVTQHRQSWEFQKYAQGYFLSFHKVLRDVWVF